MLGFLGVECGVDIYQYALEDLKVARETAGVEQVHINAPTGMILVVLKSFGVNVLTLRR